MRLIKENHILACSSITEAIKRARTKNPNKFLEVEVENLDELKEALSVNTDRILLDNFKIDTIKKETKNW